MRLYIIRHADPDYPNNTITEAGHAEARALAQRLAGEGLTRLYSSPLGRAQDTAAYTAEVTGLQVGIEPWTRELAALRMPAGPLQGGMLWDAHGHLLRAQREDALAERLEQLDIVRQTRLAAARAAAAADSDGSQSPSGDNNRPDPARVDRYGEVVEAVRSESDAFLARHGYDRAGTSYRVVRPNRERIAVFCHGGLGLTWLAHLLAIPMPLMWAGFWLPPSSVTTVLMDEREDDLATPRCLGVGDVSHLYAERLPVQPAGVKTNFD